MQPSKILLEACAWGQNMFKDRRISKLSALIPCFELWADVTFSLCLPNEICKVCCLPNEICKVF